MTKSIIVQRKDTSSFKIYDNKAYKKTIISFTLNTQTKRAVLIWRLSSSLNCWVP